MLFLLFKNLLLINFYVTIKIQLITEFKIGTLLMPESLAEALMTAENIDLETLALPAGGGSGLMAGIGVSGGTAG